MNGIIWKPCILCFSQIPKVALQQETLLVSSAGNDAGWNARTFYHYPL